MWAGMEMWPRAGNWPCNGHAHAACSTRAICCDLELPAGWGVLLHTLLHRRGCYYRSYYRLRRCISALLHCARFLLASYYNCVILYHSECISPTVILELLRRPVLQKGLVDFFCDFPCFGFKTPFPTRGFRMAGP